MHGSTSCQDTRLDLSSVVDLAHVDHLAATSAGNFLGVTLAHESLVGSLDSVHLVARAADSCSKDEQEMPPPPPSRKRKHMHSRSVSFSGKNDVVFIEDAKRKAESAHT